MMSDELMKKIGKVTHDEAEAAVDRMIASHFNRPDKEHMRASIPADPKRDDDLRMLAYVEQQRLRDTPEEVSFEDIEQIARKMAIDAGIDPDAETETENGSCWLWWQKCMGDFMVAKAAWESLGFLLVKKG